MRLFTRALMRMVTRARRNARMRVAISVPEHHMLRAHLACARELFAHRVRLRAGIPHTKCVVFAPTRKSFVLNGLALR